MTPLLEIEGQESDRTGWLRIDLRDDENVEAIVVIPLFGRDHHAGMDCWCQPCREGRIIVHNQCH